MYRGGADYALEETYIMGHRMISFLTECLPKHPDFRTSEVADLRRHSHQELELLQRCLEDVALQIDEDQCNQFVADFDPIVLIDDDSDDETEDSIPENPIKDWVAFGGWTEKDEPWTEDGLRKADSPSSETVATTGTGSVEAFDFSSSDESIADRQLDFSDYEEVSSPKPIYTIEMDTDFLEQIAKEDVQYETDSEAADSWAQDADSYATSASSGTAVTCDPARLAFRELLNKTRSNFLSPIKGEESDESSSQEKETPRRPDPQAQLPPKSNNECPVETEMQIYLEEDPGRQAFAVDSEIQRYLGSSGAEDPDSVFESTMEKLKDTSSLSSSSDSSPSSAFRTFTRAEKENLFTKPDVLEQDNWVSFETSNGIQSSVQFGSQWNRRDP
jgi:hypothetical protein